jgi:hypothetical protein
MSETMSTTAGEVFVKVKDECRCDACGGDFARDAIEQLTKDLVAHPDLAAKLFITLKMAAEPKR